MSVAVKFSDDGGWESHGHSAKFCCHSLMHNSKIVDVQLSRIRGRTEQTEREDHVNRVLNDYEATSMIHYVL